MGDSIERRRSTIPALAPRDLEQEVLGRKIRFGKEQIDLLSSYPVVKKLELHGPDGENKAGVIIPLPGGFQGVLVLTESGDGFVMSKDDKLGADDVPSKPVDDETWRSFHTIDLRTATLIDGHSSPLSVNVTDFTSEAIGQGLLGNNYDASEYMNLGSSNPQQGAEYYGIVKFAGENITHLLALLQTGAPVRSLDSLKAYEDWNTRQLYEGLAIRVLPTDFDHTSNDHADIHASE